MNTSWPTRVRLAPAASQGLDVMRGSAALLVFLNHWRELFFAEYPALRDPNLLTKSLYFISGFGHQSVIIFFVLSGFLVGGSVMRQFGSNIFSWDKYLFARGTRLYVVLIPALLLGLTWDTFGLRLFGDAGVYGGHGSQNVIQTPVSATISAASFVVNLSFLQGVAGPTFGSNGALWSLAYEFWYYIAFPCVLFCLDSRSTRRNRIVYLILLSFVFVITGRWIFLYFLIWLAGAAVALLPACRKRVAQVLLALSLALLTCTLAWIRHSRPNEVASDLFLGIVCTGVLYSLIMAMQGEGSRPLQQVAGRLANSSYTLYLVHIPALAFASAMLGGKHGSTLQRGQIFGSLLVLIAVFLYSQLVYSAFEAKTDKLRRTGSNLIRWFRAVQLGA